MFSTERSRSVLRVHFSRNGYLRANFTFFQVKKHGKMISVKISAGQFESICVDEVSLVLYAMEINKSVLTCFDLRTPTKVLIFNGKSMKTLRVYVFHPQLLHRQLFDFRFRPQTGTVGCFLKPEVENIGIGSQN